MQKLNCTRFDNYFFMNRRNHKFIPQLKKWIFLMQNKLKKQLIAKGLYQYSFSLKKRKIFDEITSNKDRRIFLGAMRFTPSIITSCLKNLPLPWIVDFDLTALIHKNGLFFSIKQKNLVYEALFVSQWNIWWFLCQKKKFQCLNFRRITFPIFDDLELTSSNYSFISNSVGINFPKNTNFWFYQNTKEWLFQNQIIFDSYWRQKIHRVFIVDSPILIHFKKIELWTGLTLLERSEQSNNTSIKELQKKFWKNKERRIYSQYLAKKKKKNLSEIVKISYYPFLFSIFSDINSKIKTKMSSQPYCFCILNQNNHKKKEANCFVDIHHKKSSNHFWNLEKKQTKNFPSQFFMPMFFDFFFTEKRLFSYFDLNYSGKSNTKRVNYLQWQHVIPILKRIIITINISTKSKYLTSFFSLLKNYVIKNSYKKHQGLKKKFNFDKILESSSFFIQKRMSWIESGMQICLQSYTMMQILLGRKNLNYLNLDFNFNLKPLKTLTTKERKKSRFSNSFHLLREILRFTKLIIDSHLKFKKGNINIYQLSDGIHYIFTHMGHLTGIYRYKYKVMKQIHLCKSIKRILYEKFNQKTAKKGPGFGFWAPVWRIWIFFLKGISPMLQRWLSNLLSRHFFGRKNLKKSLEISNQREEAYLDIGIKQALCREINLMSSNSKKIINIRQIWQLFDNAWRCWKSGIFWDVQKISKKTKFLIYKFVKWKASWWVKSTYIEREKIQKGIRLDKNTLKKNLGRITRLWFKHEKKRQYDYIRNGPFISKKEGYLTHQVFLAWIEAVCYRKISFPSFSFKKDIKLLILALENLRNLHNNSKKSVDKELDIFLDDPFLALTKIKENILTQKAFLEIGINFLDNFSHLIPVFQVEIGENLVDMFLDQYLWYEGIKTFLFPPWIKPTDSEIAPFNAYKVCSHINNILGDTNNPNTSSVIFLHTTIAESFENVDLNFLNFILKMIMNSFLSNYIISRYNSCFSHKDLKFINSFGIIKGLVFSPFVIQIYLLLIDLLILGIPTALSMKNYLCSSIIPYHYHDQRNSIFLYSRCLTNSLILLKHDTIFSSQKIFADHEQSHTIKLTDSSNYDLASTIKKIEKRIPISIGKIVIADKSIFNFKFEQKRLPCLLKLCGFEIKITSKNLETNKTCWKYLGEESKKTSFSPTVCDWVIKQFQNRIRQIILTSNSTSFSKITNRWNSNLLGILLYFREATYDNLEFQKNVLKSEEKIQTRIKISLNSKMPSRFPAVLFYSPKELGGLGMISISNYKILENDLKFAKKYDIVAKNFVKKTKQNQNVVPSLNRYFLSWEEEFIDSKLIWLEYLRRRLKKNDKKIQILFEDIEDLLDRGIPRINTLFQKDRNLLAYDYGWRIRGEFKKYQIARTDPFWWTNQRHDGKIWNLSNYRIDILEALGSIPNILEHTLFKGTYFSSWEGLFWEKASGFEENFGAKKLTQAQRTGLNQIPNRRFTLWWSPTINRADVYVGFQVQLDLTGIFMHGKIPTLKISLIQIFRGHLWQKIHESLVISVCQKLEEKCTHLGIQTVQKEQIHPRKAYKMNSSCADIILFAHDKWYVTPPKLVSSITMKEEDYASYRSDKFWIDLQLRWGDFDSHDIERYAKGKFLDFSTDKISVYPCKAGIVASIDLAYNISSIFGNWFNGLHLILEQAFIRIIKTNPSLFILRERIKKGLQLYMTEQQQILLNFDNFYSTFHNETLLLVDDSCFYRVSIHKTNDGNLTAKPINGALFFFAPQSGFLTIKISHVSLWKGHKRLTQFAKWKAAEETNLFVSSIPENERPNMIIATKKNMIDSIQIHLISHAEILVKGTDIRLNFQNILKIKKIGNEVISSTCSKMIIFLLYDDWLDSISRFTAFSRIVLILKGLENDFEYIRNIFGDFNFSSQLTFWPKYSDQKWIEIEILIKNLIVQKYCKKNRLHTNFLSQTTIKNIIFGLDVTENNANKDLEIIEKFQKKTLKTTDKLGRKLKVSVLNSENSQGFISHSRWTIRKFFSKNFQFRSSSILINFDNVDKENPNIVLPRNLVKVFIKTSDLTISVISYLFGKQFMDKNNIFEVRLFLIPPQICLKGKIETPSKIPFHQILTTLEFIGLLRMSSNADLLSTNDDVICVNSISKTNFMKPNTRPAIVKINFRNDIYHISGFFVKEIDTEYPSFNEKSTMAIFLSNRFFGFFLMPKKIKWNVSLQKSSIFKKYTYSLSIKCLNP